MGDALPVRSVDARVVGKWENVEAGSSEGTAATDSASRLVCVEGDDKPQERRPIRNDAGCVCATRRFAAT